MKILLLLLCVAFAGCGAKSNEEIAKDLVEEKLKTTLPDFNNNYESVNYGTLGTAFLPYEETEQYKKNSMTISDWNDSVIALEKIIKENKTAAGSEEYKKRLQQLQDSTKAKSERNSSEKQSYTPEKLFKITHAYNVKDKQGIEKKTEDEFYFDKDLKKVLKVKKIY
ncbi:MAG: hypothetical protein ABIQ31_15110 [Ferruginibacter sp.]